MDRRLDAPKPMRRHEIAEAAQSHAVQKEPLAPERGRAEQPGDRPPLPLRTERLEPAATHHRVRPIKRGEGRSTYPHCGGLESDDRVSVVAPEPVRTPQRIDVRGHERDEAHGFSRFFQPQP